MRLQSLVVSLVLCGVALGTAWGGSIDVTDPAPPDARDFGNVPIFGAAATATVTLTNSGNETQVTGFSPNANCAEFTASATFGGMPVSGTNPAVLNTTNG